jgi:hypothetical protein
MFPDEKIEMEERECCSKPTKLKQDLRPSTYCSSMDFLKRKPISKRRLNELSFQNNQSMLQTSTSQKALKFANDGNSCVAVEKVSRSQSIVSIAGSCDSLQICSDCETKLQAMREKQSTANKPLCTADSQLPNAGNHRRSTYSGSRVSADGYRLSIHPDRVSTNGSRISSQSVKKCENCGSSIFTSQSSSISIRICLKCLQKEKSIADQGISIAY